MAADAFVMRRALVEQVGSHEVVVVDTIAHLKPEDRGRIVATGSHNNISSGEYAGRVPIAAVFFNDAGIGKDEAGTAALPYLQAMGIAAGTVAHDSAIIGDAEETWRHGRVSALNEGARTLGFREGEGLLAEVRRIFGGGLS